MHKFTNQSNLNFHKFNNQSKICVNLPINQILNSHKIQQLTFQIFQKNFAALLILFTECFFTVIPNILYLVTDNIILPFVDLRIATLRAIGYSTDAMVTTTVYWITWNKVIFGGRVVKPSGIQVHVNTNNATIPTTNHWFWLN